jgi:hypothetical protein
MSARQQVYLEQNKINSLEKTLSVPHKGMTKNIVTFLALSRSATRIVKELFGIELVKLDLSPKITLFIK